MHRATLCPSLLSSLSLSLFLLIRPSLSFSLLPFFSSPGVCPSSHPFLQPQYVPSGLLAVGRGLRMTVVGDTGLCEETQLS